MKTKNMIAGLVMLIAGFGLACGDSTVSPVSPSITDPIAPAGNGSLSTGSSTGQAGLPQTTAGSVRLRVAHLSTDAPPVDIWVNGAVALSNVAYKTVSDYLALDSGEYRIQVTPTGAASPIVIDATLDLMGGKVYTVAAIGFLSSTPGSPNAIQPLVLLDNLSTGAGARIRIVHASADTGAVDVAVTSGPILFSNIRFAQASDYGEVPGGTYNLEVRPSGSSAVALAIPGLEVSDGTTYTVFAIGRSFNGTLEALPVVDAQ